MRQTIFGSLTDEPYPTKNEKAVLYIVDVAKSVGIEVTDNTALDFQFIAKVVKKLKESHIKELEEIKTEIKNMELYMSSFKTHNKVIEILDNHIKEDKAND